ncbi:DUF2065 domain-containing protein [Candidatus Aalborgicola defluviihabitans]|uniref:DUF2065 domain-containing protein n=1 Tax=Candidatus Aalborgicola defluviihabitans TaxID=3386187 RepID=UPI001D9C2D82|nr:DUF2065 domain-containing protein [Burkholderiales bacterium]MBK6567842.1 DUF2065 domain-containing protein [Burkholderiales bacterium]MBK7282114.1 DUF2065 domain-containing protein [Burkholderiales bacterium]MBK7313227.1 DUF2065 domain-containing protein [Burkholderiales bacterium]
MSSDTIWLALAMVLVIEGLFPFTSPDGWRRMFTQLLALRDGQIRFFGLLSIVGGLMMIWWLMP